MWNRMVGNVIRLAFKMEDRGFLWIKKNLKIILGNVFFGIIVYFMMISGNLVNCVDGICNTSHFIAGAWETSLGRGLLHYFDTLRAGIVAMPLVATLTLLLISVSVTLFLELWPVEEKNIRLMMPLLLIASPVTGNILSHCYMAVDFGLAFLFSVIAVRWIHSKYRMAGICFGGVFIALSMGCYQAYFGISCLLILMLLIKKVLELSDWKIMVNFIIKSILTVIIGGILYMIMANALLWKYHITLSSYKGASDVSIKNIIISFPESIIRCYKSFYDYFVIHHMYLPISRKVPILLAGIGIFMLFCILRLFVRTWKKNRIYAICFLGCIGLIPVASCAIFLIVQGTGMGLLMSMSLALSPALCLLVSMESMPMGEIRHILVKQISVLLMLALLWVEILTVTNDQLALKEGMTATDGLSAMIFSQLATEGYLEDGFVIAIVGKPSENPLFAKRWAWEHANAYGKFGGDHWYSNIGRHTWVCFLAECRGLKLNFCDTGRYNELLRTNELAEMPVFPKEGSIHEIDGVVVVKVSNVF